MKPGRALSEAERAEILAEWRELRRICREEGTAIDGMTKEQAIAHMRRVREKLWKAQHVYRPARPSGRGRSKSPSSEAGTFEPPAAGPAGSGGATMRTASGPVDAAHAEARKHLENLLRACKEEGTAVDGMTKEEILAHMRRVRERLWKAKHAYHPRRE